MSARIKKTQTTPPADVDITYPQLEGLSDPQVQRSVNETLRSDAEKAVAEFLRGLTEGPQLPAPSTSPTSASDRNSLDGRFDAVEVEPEVGSFRVYLSEYHSGAAHGGTALVTYNFNLKTGHRYALAELFDPAKNWLGFLSGISRQLLTIEHVGEPGVVQEGTRPKAENFSGWVLVPDGIEVTFGEYQVASYAEGMPRILILRQAMQDLVAQSGPVR